MNLPRTVDCCWQPLRRMDYCYHPIFFYLRCLIFTFVVTSNYSFHLFVLNHSHNFLIQRFPMFRHFLQMSKQLCFSLLIFSKDLFNLLLLLFYRLLSPFLLSCAFPLSFLFAVVASCHLPRSKISISICYVAVIKPVIVNQQGHLLFFILRYYLCFFTILR